MKNDRFDPAIRINDLTAYRTCWMGAAILWLICYHGQPATNIRALSVLQNVGYGGVDIFLFASGLGCWYSLEKDPDLIRFLKRRFLNLMPVYWCFISVWIIFRYCTSGISAAEAVGNFFGIEMFASTEGSFNWYISGIWVLYILAPYMKRAVDGIKTLRGYMLLLAILFLLSVPFWNTSILLIFTSRIPIFCLGMILAKYAAAGAELKKSYVIFSLAAAAAGIILLTLGYRKYPSLLMNCALMWYPFFLITPFLCLLISLFFWKFEKTSAGSVIKKALLLLGSNTFELYLVHLFLFEGIYRSIPFAEKGIDPKTGKLLCFLAIIPGTYALSRAGKYVRSAFQKRIRLFR